MRRRDQDCRTTWLHNFDDLHHCLIDTGFEIHSCSCYRLTSGSGQSGNTVQTKSARRPHSGISVLEGRADFELMNRDGSHMRRCHAGIQVFHDVHKCRGVL